MTCCARAGALGGSTRTARGRRRPRQPATHPFSAAGQARVARRAGGARHAVRRIAPEVTVRRAAADHDCVAVLIRGRAGEGVVEGVGVVAVVVRATSGAAQQRRTRLALRPDASADTAAARRGTAFGTGGAGPAVCHVLLARTVETEGRAAVVVARAGCPIRFQRRASPVVAPLRRAVGVTSARCAVHLWSAVAVDTHIARALDWARTWRPVRLGDPAGPLVTEQPEMAVAILRAGPVRPLATATVEADPGRAVLIATAGEETAARQWTAERLLAVWLNDTDPRNAVLVS